jgi:hypothetical protein
MVPCRRDLLVPILIAPPPTSVRYLGGCFGLDRNPSVKLSSAHQAAVQLYHEQCVAYEQQRLQCQQQNGSRMSSSAITRCDRAPRTNRTRSLPLSPRCFETTRIRPPQSPAAAIGLAPRRLQRFAISRAPCTVVVSPRCGNKPERRRRASALWLLRRRRTPKAP